jgi:hypothetical protein
VKQLTIDSVLDGCRCISVATVVCAEVRHDVPKDLVARLAIGSHVGCLAIVLDRLVPVG